MTDSELYAECKKFGTESLRARWKFLGLLPEVMRREMKSMAQGKSWLEKRGYEGIYMFAAKLAGVSHEQVDLMLRLDKRFEDLPILRTALVNGDVSPNKLYRIVSIANQKNQKELLEKCKKLSLRALELIAKNKNQNGLHISKVIQKTVPGNTKIQSSISAVNVQQIDVFEQRNEKPNPHSFKPEPIAKITTLQLDPEIERQLIELQQKGININELLKTFLQQREQKIDQQMQTMRTKDTQPAKSRYINVQTRQLLKQKFGTKCAEPSCNKPAVHIHHQKPFAKYHTHDPQHLRPLCKTHHELAHQNDARIQNFRTQMIQI